MANILKATLFLISLILVHSFPQDKRREKTKECEMAQADVLFILDESTSIFPKDYELQKEFLIKMVKSYHVASDEVRIAIISFATKTKTRFDFNQYSTKDEMIAAIEDFKQLYGDTHTWEAMKHARNSVLTKVKGARRGNVPQIGIVITDGNSQEPSLTKSESAKTREETGIKMYAIGIGKRISKRELLHIAGSEDRIINVDDYEQLLNEESMILDESCQAEDDKCGGRYGVDAAFVMDTPNAGHHDLMEANAFTKFVVGKLDFEGGKTRVASIVSECTKLSSFNLNTYKSKEDVIDALTIKHEKSTKLETLMSQTAARLFSEEFGARKKAKKAIVLLTDGKSGDINSLSQQSHHLKANNVEVFVIGVGDKVSKNALNSIATDPHHVTMMPDYESLQSVVIRDMLATGICKPPLRPETKEVTKSANLHQKREDEELVEVLEKIVERLGQD